VKTERYKKMILLVSLLLIHLPLTVLGERSLPGKYEICTSCHGVEGVSNYTLFPNIAGQKRSYMVQQLKAFRDGRRHDPWMTPIAGMLSDKEIEALADFYSGL